MSEKMNGKIEQYVVLQSIIRSVAECVFLLLMARGISWILGENSVNVVFLDQFLIISIVMGNAFDIQNTVCGKAHVFAYSRKKIFRNTMYSAFASTLVFAFWRTLWQSVFYAQYVQEFSEDEIEPLVFTRVPLLELFCSNCILIFALCTVLIWRYGSGRSGFISIGQDMNGYSAQMRYRIMVRKKRRNIFRKIRRLAYRLLEFVVLVTVMVSASYLYYFQLQTEIGMRMAVYGGILVIGILFFLFAKRWFRPEYM